MPPSSARPRSRRSRPSCSRSPGVAAASRGARRGSRRRSRSGVSGERAARPCATARAPPARPRPALRSPASAPGSSRTRSWAEWRRSTPTLAQYLPQAALAALVPALVLAAVLWSDPLSALVLLADVPARPALHVADRRPRPQARTRRQWVTLSRLAARFLDALAGLATLRAFGRVDDEARVLEQANERHRTRHHGGAAPRLRLRPGARGARDARDGGGRGRGRPAPALRAGSRSARRSSCSCSRRSSTGRCGRWVPRFTRGWPGGKRPRAWRRSSRPKGPLAAPARFWVGRRRPVPRRGPAGAAAAPPVRVGAASRTTPGAPALSTASRSSSRPGRRSRSSGRPAPARRPPPTCSCASSSRTRAGSSSTTCRSPRSLPRSGAGAWRGCRSTRGSSTGRCARTCCSASRRPPTSRSAARWSSPTSRTLVRELPRGLETPVGEGGERLSGGEAQRVALARAFLKDAPVLVLDEPTAQLDLATEARVVEAVERLLPRPDRAARRAPPHDGRRGRTASPSSPTGAWSRRAPRRRSRRRAACTRVCSRRGEARLERAAGPCSSGSSSRSGAVWAPPSALQVLTIATGVGLMGTSAWLLSKAALHPSIAALQVAIVGVRAFGVSRASPPLPGAARRPTTSRCGCWPACA